jgi:hypothetical protein
MRVIPPIEIELDKVRHIVLTHGVLRATEIAINRQRGASVQTWAAIETIINSALPGRIFPMDLTEALLFHALLIEDDKLTLDKVRDLIDDRYYVNGKLMEACALCWPAPKADDVGAIQESPSDGDPGDNPTKRPNGAGSNAGPLAESKLN